MSEVRPLSHQLAVAQGFVGWSFVFESTATSAAHGFVGSTGTDKAHPLGWAVADFFGECCLLSFAVGGGPRGRAPKIGDRVNGEYGPGTAGGAPGLDVNLDCLFIARESNAGGSDGDDAAVPGDGALFGALPKVAKPASTPGSKLLPFVLA
mmetsp:Transcript_31925/g.70573  ORF Transcript_31925/g.70573 Transcript_31925/m.70573 type:complete len:151 (+) Transcript_31925:80-532(+)